MSHPPFSAPDFSGVRPEHLLEAMRMCEMGKGDEVLAHFEHDFAELVGAKYAVAVSSATAGLHLAMLALGVSAGDEVICPTFTFAASAFPITYQKANPVFVDSEETTWNMSPTYLEEAILQRTKAGKKPKAIVLVHAYGTPANISGIMKLAEKYAVPVVEDAANALGATWGGKHVGGFGALGVFSFNRNKIVSGGAGGCIVTNDEKLAQKARYLAHQAKSQLPYYHHENIGYNYGLSPILAEIIRVQLPFLGEQVLQRHKTFRQYKRFLGEAAVAQHELEHGASNRWLSAFKVSDEEEKQKQLLNLSQNHVEVRRLWKPMHLQPVFRNSSYIGHRESEFLWKNGFCLPAHFQVVPLGV
jgi:dTDP-4-amino-4,6-dideoxygalactose transaminase